MSGQIPGKLPHENYKEFAYRVLRSQIMDLQLLPGTILNEAAIASRLQVSRTPVHEAVKQLAKERLIDVRPNLESRVSPIDYHLMEESIFARICIEPALIDQIKGNLSKVEVQSFLENLQRQQSAMEQGDFPAFMDLDGAFHQLIFDCANRSYTYQMLRKYAAHLDRFRQLLLRCSSQEKMMRRAYGEHRRLFFMMVISLPAQSAISDLIRDHAASALSDYTVIVQEFPAYFSLPPENKA